MGLAGAKENYRGEGEDRTEAGFFRDGGAERWRFRHPDGRIFDILSKGVACSKLGTFYSKAFAKLPTKERQELESFLKQGHRTFK